MLKQLLSTSVLLACATFTMLSGCSSGSTDLVSASEDNRESTVATRSTKSWKKVPINVSGKIVAMSVRRGDLSGNYVFTDSRDIYYLSDYNSSTSSFPYMSHEGKTDFTVKKAVSVYGGYAAIDEEGLLHTYNGIVGSITQRSPGNSIGDISYNVDYDGEGILLARSKDGHTLYTANYYDGWHLEPTYKLTNGTKGSLFSGTEVSADRNNKPVLGYSSARFRTIGGTEPFDSYKKGTLVTVAEVLTRRMRGFDFARSHVSRNKSVISWSSKPGYVTTYSRVFIYDEVTKQTEMILDKSSANDVYPISLSYDDYNRIWRLDSDGGVYVYE